MGLEGIFFDLVFIGYIKGDQACLKHREPLDDWWLNITG